VADAQLSNIAETHQLLSAYAFYVQDDWEALEQADGERRLRYDFMTPAYEEDNHMFTSARRRASRPSPGRRPSTPLKLDM